ncbi:MAG TPA: phosphoenolpyruvate-utilizing N-terminal domain-containing protein, partial [Bacillota bacterium]|nr:phosphoenolpyruvate-utilizing N-terminal domain-containing protein [Bacillota bacterium]
MLKGIAASPGMVIGRSVVLALESLDINMRLLNFDEVQGELERLGIAIEQSKIQLQQVLELALREVGPEEARIFEAQALILDDYLLLTTIKNSITEERINVEAAVDRAIQMFASVMEGAADDYTRERALDIRDVGRRLIRNLLGHDPQPIQPLDEPAVIFAYDLSPSDTVSLDKSMVLGFATELGGKTSHTAILAKSLGIPAVVGVGPKLREVGSRSQVILDGNLGQIFLNPSKDLVGIYHQRIEEEHRRKERLARLRDLPAVTLDGFRVSLEGN